ncbi:MAG: ATP-binding protein, partial [Kiritimatiellia bacterium]|nr:ATP-binding protein [Kiritimatiellia bacterium]
WFNCGLVAVRDAEGKLEGVEGIGTDITELMEAEINYQTLFDKMLNGFALHEMIYDAGGKPADYRFLAVNPAFERMTGLTAKKVVGKSVLEILPGTEPHWIEAYGRVALTGEPVFFENHSETLGKHFEVTAFRPAPNRFACIFSDVTDRKQAQYRVEHLNRVLRAIRDVNQLIVRERDREAVIREGCRLMVSNRGYASSFIALTDAAGRVIQWTGSGLIEESASMRALLDRGELPPCCIRVESDSVGLVVEDRQKICGVCPLIEACGDTLSMCMRLAHADREYGYLVVAVEKAQSFDAEERDLLQEVAEDLGYALHNMETEAQQVEAERQQARLQEQLNQAQKMESVGRLAGGVAHDFNNLLMGILGYVELARDHLDPEHPVREYLDEVTRNANRSADLTRQLLAFARRQTVAPKVLDLNDTIASLLSLLRRLLGEDIDRAWMPGLGVAPVKIDPTQVDQILANLCVNARDAISGVGKLTIETDNVTIDAAYAEQHPEALCGEYVRLSVSDSGCGMSSETLLHVFEPFFTTKERDKGTGLGLATVYGIVKQNNGFVNVYSEPGQGSTFRIYLPRVLETPEPTASPVLRALPTGGTETVLLVEDEDAIRKIVGRYLSVLGYDVIPASNPDEALELIKDREAPIPLLITDVVMPGMSGRDLSLRLRERWPSMRTLFMSGYTANAIAHQGILDEGVDFLQKPVSMAALAGKMRDMLNADRADSH